MAKRKNVGEEDSDFVIRDGNIVSILNMLISELVRNFNLPEFDNKGNALMYGINIKITKNGKPILAEIGNMNLFDKAPESEKKDIMVDVIERDNEYTIIAELPNIEKKSIKISADAKSFTISAKDSSLNYLRKIPLKERVDPNSGKVRYNNGILELSVKKDKNSTGGNIRLTID